MKNYSPSRRRPTSFFTICLLLIAGAGAPAQASIVYLADNRMVEEYYSDERTSIDEIFTPDPLFSDWTYSGSESSIAYWTPSSYTSHLGGNGFDADMYVAAGPTPYDISDAYRHYKTFDASFSLSEAGNFTLTGAWNGSGDSLSTASIALYRGTEMIAGNAIFQLEPAWEQDPPDPYLPPTYHLNTPFSFASVLDSGDYRIVASIDAWNAGYEGSVTHLVMQADFSPVPIPSALWLLLTGMAGLFSVARQRTTH